MRWLNVLVIVGLLLSGGVPVAARSGLTSELAQVSTSTPSSTPTATMTPGVQSNGSVVGTWWYLPYGKKRAKSGALHTTYRYTGQRWDSVTALYYYGARRYDPTLARCIQPDTIVPNPGDPQSLNRYGYAGNNPVRYTDPSGHKFVERISGLERCDSGASLSDCRYPEGYAQKGWLIGTPIPSATSVGLPLGASVTTPAFSFSVSGAIEVVADNNSLAYTVFLKYELGFQIGLNESRLGGSVGHGLWSVNVEPGLPALANIYNVEDIAVDYAGPSRSLSGSAAYGPGIQWGEDADPDEISMPANERVEASYSRFVSPVLTVNLEHPTESRLYNPYIHIPSMLRYFRGVISSAWHP